MSERARSDVMAIISRSIFEKRARKGTALLGPGEVFGIDRYTSTNRALDPLEGGGRLFLVTVRPPDEALWLVGVLDALTRTDEAWVAARVNRTPIADISSLRSKIRFASGQGMSDRSGALGMSLQVPRVLTAADVELIESLASVPEGSGARGGDWALSVPRRATEVRTALAGLAFGPRAIEIAGKTGAGATHRIVLMAAERGGFLVQWMDHGPASTAWWLLGDSARRGRARVMLENGQVDEIAARFLATLEQALAAVAAFLATGAREPSLAWENVDGGDVEGDGDELDRKDEGRRLEDGARGSPPTGLIAPSIAADLGARLAVPARPDRAWTRQELELARARLIVDRYERKIAGAALLDADIVLLDMLLSEARRAADRLAAPDDAGAPEAIAVTGAVRDRIAEVERRVRAAQAGWPFDRVSLLAKRAEKVAGIYAAHFAKQSRSTRRPALLARMIQELESVRDGLQPFRYPAALAAHGVVERRLAFYRTEAAEIDALRRATPVAVRVARLRGKLAELRAALDAAPSGSAAADVLLDQLDEVRLSLEDAALAEGEPLGEGELQAIVTELLERGAA